jgi:hypothetical protein
VQVPSRPGGTAWEVPVRQQAFDLVARRDVPRKPAAGVTCGRERRSGRRSREGRTRHPRGPPAAKGEHTRGVPKRRGNMQRRVVSRRDARRCRGAPEVQARRD